VHHVGSFIWSAITIYKCRLGYKNIYVLDATVLSLKQKLML